jgi:hypothetical protein
MFGFDVKVEPQFDRVQRAADDATFRNLRHAGFGVSKSAKESIKTSEEPSQAGTPPTTRGKGRNNLRSAIFVDASADEVIVGPRFSYVGDSGEAHEFGVSRKGDDFDERSFMGPALDQNISRFASDWQGSIGQ